LKRELEDEDPFANEQLPDGVQGWRSFGASSASASKGIDLITRLG
jgi:hypothetical protein